MWQHEHVHCAVHIIICPYESSMCKLWLVSKYNKCRQQMVFNSKTLIHNIAQRMWQHEHVHCAVHIIICPYESSMCKLWLVSKYNKCRQQMVFNSKTLIHNIAQRMWQHEHVHCAVHIIISPYESSMCKLWLISKYNKFSQQLVFNNKTLIHNIAQRMWQHELVHCVV